MNRIVKKFLHSQPTIEDDDIEAVVKILRLRQLDGGESVGEFERFIRGYFGKKFAIAVSSGFAAIHLSLIALGVSQGDEVILPSYACKALLNPVKLVGGKPVVVDIEPNSFNISVDSVKKAITTKTKVIIVPHIFGFPARIEELVGIGIPIIEDCAQSIGGVYQGKKLGTFGDLAIFSFYATKVIASGDGGMILTDDIELYQRIQDHKYYGHKKSHHFLEMNYHMTDIPAALGLSQIRKLERFIDKRVMLANHYTEIFSKDPRINTNFINKHESIYYRYPIQIDKRDFMMSELQKRNIYCGYGVLEGNHVFVQNGCKLFVNTQQMLSEILSLPIYPGLEYDDINYIASNVVELLDK